jgi:two-component system, LytTR family, sensor kinase
LKNFLPYSSLQIITIISIWWLSIAAVQTYVIHLYQINWHFSFIDAAVSATLLTLITISIVFIYKFYQPSYSNHSIRLLLAIALTALYGYILKQVYPFCLYQYTDSISFLEWTMPIRLIIAFLIVGFITILFWLWNGLNEQKENEKRRNSAEQLLKNAELEKLRQQLQPHFLFNSLNSISALAGTKPEIARKMIQQLSDFLRGTIKKDQQKTVPLNEELEHLQLYLEIEKVRFGHRLEVVVENKTEAYVPEIPPLLLQPLVENAIKFGLYGNTGNISIQLVATITNDYLNIRISNPFDSISETSNQGTGFGLSAISRRLFLLYARNDLMQIKKQDGVFTANLIIPQNNLTIKKESEVL